VITSTGPNANTGRKGIFVARRRKYYCITLQYNFYNPNVRWPMSAFSSIWLVTSVILCNIMFVSCPVAEFFNAIRLWRWRIVG